MSKLNPSVLEKIANQLAATVPDWAGRKFTPLLSWWQDGEDILLLGSDGRKIRFVSDEVKRIVEASHKERIKDVMSLPIHTMHGATTDKPTIQSQAGSQEPPKPSHSQSPAKSKAGK